MFIASASSTSDPLGRYYTDPVVGALLVDAMGIECPSTVMDICAGDGALVSEAAKLWSNSSFLTVDIEVDGQAALLNKLNGRLVSHYVGDALDLNLADRIGIQDSGVDAALCNPPYIRPKWKKHYSELLEDAGLSHVFSRIREVPADLLFVAQNLRLLRHDGKVGFILPDGIVAGERYSRFRAALIQNHMIECVIELPRRIFRGTDAKAHIVVVAKNGCKRRDSIAVKQLIGNGTVSKQIKIDLDTAIRRLDYSYLSAQRKRHISKINRKIGDIAIKVFRGGYSSTDIFRVHFPVFHTSDFSEFGAYVPKRFSLDQENRKLVNKPIALPGDILIARVGRNLSQKVCMVKTGKIAVSDCVLVLRVPLEYRDDVFSFLRSYTGRAALESVSHGVGAQFITVHSLLELDYSASL